MNKTLPVVRLDGTVKEWNEADHPREPAGSSTGGQFASNGGGGAGMSDRERRLAEVKKALKGLKLPGGPRARITASGYDWIRTGGPARLKEMGVASTSFKTAGWTLVTAGSSGGNPDGSYMYGTNELWAKDGWVGELRATIGPSKADNTHYISVRRAKR